MGADFDVEEAQKLLDAAEPGETVTVPAQVELPAVTAEELEQVLFRDVLGEARTHVGGTSARRSNVKLSAASTRFPQGRWKKPMKKPKNHCLHSHLQENLKVEEKWNFWKHTPISLS